MVLKKILCLYCESENFNIITYDKPHINPLLSLWAFVACFKVNFTVHLLLQCSNAAMQLALCVLHYEVLHYSTGDWQFALCIVNHSAATVIYILLRNLR